MSYPGILLPGLELSGYQGTRENVRMSNLSTFTIIYRKRMYIGQIYGEKLYYIAASKDNSNNFRIVELFFSTAFITYLAIGNTMVKMKEKKKYVYN